MSCARGSAAAIDAASASPSASSATAGGAAGFDAATGAGATGLFAPRVGGPPLRSAADGPRGGGAGIAVGGVARPPAEGAPAARAAISSGPLRAGRAFAGARSAMSGVRGDGAVPVLPIGSVGVAPSAPGFLGGAFTGPPGGPRVIPTGTPKRSAPPTFMRAGGASSARPGRRSTSRRKVVFSSASSETSALRSAMSRPRRTTA